jgi:hypothetical protein
MSMKINRSLLIAVASLATGFAAFADDVPAGSVKIDLQLPKPMFIGTPKNIKRPNLEAPRSAPLPTFIVAPEGTTNLAAKKTVTASDKEPVIGELTQVTDGDKEGKDGSYVEFGPGTQWVQIDLGKNSTLYAVVVWHYHSEARVYKATVVQVSDDPDFIKDVKTIYNNDADNSNGLGIGQDKEYIETYSGRIFDAKGVKGRYVRLYSKGNTSTEMNDYTEVEVYGK